MVDAFSEHPAIHLNFHVGVLLLCVVGKGLVKHAPFLHATPDTHYLLPVVPLKLNPALDTTVTPPVELCQIPVIKLKTQ